MKSSVFLLVLLSAAVSVVAQPLAPAPDSPGLDRRPVWTLSPAGALAISTGTTAAGLGLATVLYEAGRGSERGVQDAALVLYGVALAAAPSAGNLALGNRRDALIGTGLRAVGAGLVAVPLSNFGDSGLSTAESLTALGGAVLFLGGLGYDVVTQARGSRKPRHVRRAEARRIRIEPGGAGLALRVGL